MNKSKWLTHYMTVSPIAFRHNLRLSPTTAHAQPRGIRTYRREPLVFHGVLPFKRPSTGASAGSSLPTTPQSLQVAGYSSSCPTPEIQKFCGCLIMSLPGLHHQDKIPWSLQMDKQALLRALQVEIQRHDLRTFVDEPQSGHGVVVPGCSLCRKRFNRKWRRDRFALKQIVEAMHFATTFTRALLCRTDMNLIHGLISALPTARLLRVSVANYQNHAAIGVWYKPRQCFCHR